MTPEEIAEKIVNDERWLDFDYVGDDDRRVPDVNKSAIVIDIAVLVRAAIRNAYEDAYERAALVCDAAAEGARSRARIVISEGDINEATGRSAAGIAAIIRKLGPPT